MLPLNQIDSVCQRVPEENRSDVLIKHLLKHIDTRMGSLLKEALREHDLNHVSFTALLMLYNAQADSINPSVLSAATGESRANVTRICDELLKKGLLTRAPSQEDRRRIDLKLALAGEAEIERLLPLMRTKLSILFSCFDNQEKKELETLLKRLLAHLCKY